MIKQNKAKILLSSAVILLPAVYGIIMWNHLPDTMATHWGADGITDGTAGKVRAVFGLPLLYLLVHLFCLWLTLRDQEKRRQSRKALEVMFWILPACSLVTSGILYRAASGKELGPAMLVPVLLGILFLWVGNYFPSSEETGRLASRFRGRSETRKTGTGRTALPERSGSAEAFCFLFPRCVLFRRWPG